MSETKKIDCEVSIAREDLHLDSGENDDEVFYIDFDAALIKRIKELHKAVIATRAESIQELNDVVKWDKFLIFGEPLIVEHQTLHVSEDNVWWTCYCANTLDRIYTSEIQIEKVFALETEADQAVLLKKISQYYDKDLNETQFRALDNKVKVEIPTGLIFSSEGDIEAFCVAAKKAFARV